VKTILVVGLVPAISKEDLLQLFEEHGSVMGVDMVEGQDFGFVRMTHEGEGRKAIDALDGTYCSGVMLSVGAARTRRQREIEGSEVARATEVVNG
jgi:RNA recognition motif-containing protein